MIIGLTGKKGSGKTLAANYFIEKGYTKINFKDALIKEMRERLPNVLAELSKTYQMSIDNLFEQKPPIMRALLQNYGTEVRRKDNENYWVDKWKSLVTPQTVVDDVRFLNEADVVKEKGGIIIRIVLLGQEHTDTHISEIEMDSIEPDYTVTAQKGDFDTLYSELDKIYEIATTTEDRRA